MTFGNILKKLRDEKKYTRHDLARELNISYSAIAKYESDIRFPDAEILKKLSVIFDVSTDYLLGNGSRRIMEEQILIDYNSLSDESKKDFERFLELLKIKDSQENLRNMNKLDKNT